MPTMPFIVIPTPLGTMTTTGADYAGHPVSHLNEFDTIGMTWWSNGDGAGSYMVRGDFGSAQPVDFMGMLKTTGVFGHSLRLRLGSSQAAVDGTAGYDSGVITYVPLGMLSSDGLFHAHLELPSVQTFRWWRIDVVGPTNPFQAAALVLGKKITPSNWYAPGFQYGVEDLGKVEVTPYGVADLTPGRIFRTLTFSLGWSSETEFETKIRPLAELIGTQKVVFVCFDPTANIYRQNRTYMGWLRKPLVAQHQATTPDGPRFKMDFELLSMI